MRDWPFELPEFEPGWVWLAGAGPGDPALMTVATWHALRFADVVLYDALVDPRVLDLASRGAECIFAGKRGGRPSCRQGDITDDLVRLARENRRVLRLKGGDPFVFGRGAEEAQGLVAAGIPFRLIPGVSAGVGGLAYAGIPLTHRAINQAVTFVTGHDLKGQVPSRVDWGAIARGSPVIVLYMALSHLGEISRRLIAEGRSPEEPLAIVAKATSAQQRVIESTLADCEQAVVRHGIEPPALVVIGEVVRLRRQLDWIATLAGQDKEPGPDVQYATW